ncbi:hypothetical protein LOD99_15492 [Oopsacas minuta]|uniref:HAT C-terminal dimerisation domain-containing protein n=1 Tax=Oopsacas minuta TaxID=111878 RepID=A0AAV7KBK5_9METZ|nr:hypothetical protein LOD99_15492 [Oopsacas minuta]
MCKDKFEKPVTRLEAKGLAAIMNRLETGIMLQIWSTVLIRFNKTSKCLQDASLDLNTATKLLESLKEFVHSLRSQFMEFEHRSKVLYHCATYSKEHRRKRKRNKKFDYGDTEDAELSPSNEFMVTNFIPIIDKLVAALNQRQAAYCVIRDRFGLLSELNSLLSDQMRDKANDLVNIYSDDLEPGYVDEIVQFSAFWNRYISSDSSKTEDTKQIRDFQMFKLITRNALDTTFPNMLITLRIYLSLMLTNYSGERSFSTLKGQRRNCGPLWARIV